MGGWGMGDGGRCIAIRSFEYVYRYYLNSGGRSFVDMFNDQDGHGAGRYRDSLLPEMPMAAIRKGSAWFALERRHALALVADKLYYSRFLKHCTVVDPYCFPDEHYIPTFLNVSPPSSLPPSLLTLVCGLVEFRRCRRGESGGCLNLLETEIQVPAAN